MKENSIVILIEKLPRHGMSEDCQRFLWQISEGYFAGKPKEQLKNELSKKNKGFVDVIYDRLEQIKMNGLRNISGFFGEHPRDLREDPIFADRVIRYCIKYSHLEEKIFEIIDRFGEKEKNKEFRDLLYKQYRNGNKCNIREALQVFAKEPNLYLLIIDKISKKN